MQSDAFSGIPLTFARRSAAISLFARLAFFRDRGEKLSGARRQSATPAGNKALSRIARAAARTLQLRKSIISSSACDA
jgi:hypothetical protein